MLCIMGREQVFIHNTEGAESHTLLYQSNLSAGTASPFRTVPYSCFSLQDIERV